MKTKLHARERCKFVIDSIGPGVITGAADDDPSGIGTYSVAGAQLGTQLIWTAFLTWPLMACVQMMCARIGMVTGEGLAIALRRKLPAWVLIVGCVALFIANTLNVGADLAAMADAAGMLTGLSARLYVILFAIGITWATVKLRYASLARVLKWLALFLFAYVIAALHIGPHWRELARDIYAPRFPQGSAAWATLVAILGTTISPYLFFWQASEEIEEEKASGQSTVRSRRGATPLELTHRRWDVAMGTFFSNFVMFFIILTTALTLHAHGITEIETSKQAAEALRPIAGRFAAFLYTAGLIGTGLLAIPTLTGSAAYALAETFHWRQGLDERLGRARAFYAVIIVSTLLAVALNFSHINPVKALYGSAVVNGVLAPFLLVAIVWVAGDRAVMRNQPSSRTSRVVVGVTAAAMFGAAAAMILL